MPHRVTLTAVVANVEGSWGRDVISLYSALYNVKGVVRRREHRRIWVWLYSLIGLFVVADPYHPLVDDRVPVLYSTTYYLLGTYVVPSSGQYIRYLGNVGTCLGI